MIPTDPLSMLDDNIALLGESLFEGLEKIRAKGLEGIMVDAKEEEREDKLTSTGGKEENDEENDSPGEEKYSYEAIIKEVLTKIEKSSAAIDHSASCVGKTLRNCEPPAKNKRRYQELSEELVQTHEKLDSIVKGDGGARALLEEIQKKLKTNMGHSIDLLNNSGRR